MNITNNQMKAIRRLISKEDREAIGMHAEKSVRTIDAVLQCDRTNNEIEEVIVLSAKQNLAYLSNVIADIEAKNQTKASVIEYRKQKLAASWVNDTYYNRYMDIYLQLIHVKFSDMDELWLYVWQNCKDIVAKPYYCIDLIARLLGMEDNEAVKFFNKNTQQS